MSSKELYPVAIPSLAVAAGATTPAGGAIGSLAWSTTTGSPVVWDGTAWRLHPQQAAPTSVGTSTYTVALADMALIFSVACTVTLPAAASFAGRVLTLKNIAAFAIISNASNVKPLATNTAGTAILAATAGKFAQLVSDGANWIVMMAN